MVVMATKDDINQETEAGKVLSTRKRNLTTLLVTAAAFGNGLCFGVWGPALLDFQNLVNTSQEKISLIFTARSVGALVVMFTVSPLYDKLNTFFLFILSLVCIIVTMAAAPWSVNLAMLIAVSTVLGAALAAVFAGANTVLIRMWKEKVGPILQTMYLFFIGGNMIVPQVVRPFLGQVAMETEGQLPARTNQTAWNPNLEIRNMKKVLYTVENTTRIKNSTEDLFKINNVTDMPFKTNVYIPFTIVSGFIIIILISSFIAFASEKFQVRLPPKPTNVKPRGPKRDKLHVILIIIVFGLTIFLCVGQDLVYGSLLFLFTVKYLSWTKVQGTVIVTVFYCAQIAGRAMAIPLVKFIKPQWFALSNILIALTASVTGTLFVHSHVAVIWVVTVVFGAGVTAFFPAMLQWLNNIVPVTGFINGLISVGLPLGFMVFPALTGYLFSSVHAMWFWYIQIIGLTSSLALFITAYVMVRFNQKRRKKFTKKLSSLNIENMNGEAETIHPLKS